MVDSKLNFFFNTHTKYKNKLIKQQNLRRMRFDQINKLTQLFSKTKKKKKLLSKHFMNRDKQQTFTNIYLFSIRYYFSSYICLFRNLFLL